MAQTAAAAGEGRGAGRLQPPLPTSIGEASPARQSLARCPQRSAAILPPALALLLHGGAIAGLLAWQVGIVEPPAPDEIAIGLTFAADPPVPARQSPATVAPALAPTPDPARELPAMQPAAVAVPAAEPAPAPPAPPVSEPPPAASVAELVPPAAALPEEPLVAPTPPAKVHKLPPPRRAAELPTARPHPARALTAPQRHGPAETPAVARLASATPSEAAIVAPIAPSRGAAPATAAPQQGATLVGGMAGAGCAPRYPEAALRSGQQGLVLMRVGVGADGAPTEVAVVTSSGSPRLDGAAAEALRHCHFRPATAGGRPIPGMAEVAYRFRLEN